MPAPAQLAGVGYGRLGKAVLRAIFQHPKLSRAGAQTEVQLIDPKLPADFCPAAPLPGLRCNELSELQRAAVAQRLRAPAPAEPTGPRGRALSGAAARCRANCGAAPRCRPPPWPRRRAPRSGQP